MLGLQQGCGHIWSHIAALGYSPLRLSPATWVAPTLSPDGLDGLGLGGRPTLVHFDDVADLSAWFRS